MNSNGNEEYQITVDNLVKSELEGKSSAIVGYDTMLWKIRAGYGALLYGAIGVLAGLVKTLEPPTLIAAWVLIIGFSFCGGWMDYSFMTSKLRVVEYRDKLLALAYTKAESGFWPKGDSDLLECLKNSGERRGKISWSLRTGRILPLIYYGGTSILCSSAIGVLYFFM